MDETEVRQPHVGDAVVFCDQHSVDHNALLTAIHGTTYPDGSQPCVNLLFTSGDESRTDPYGRQIERMSSVYHVDSPMSVHGNNWRWPDEPKREYVRPKEV